MATEMDTNSSVYKQLDGVKKGYIVGTLTEVNIDEMDLGEKSTYEVHCISSNIAPEHEDIKVRVFAQVGVYRAGGKVLVNPVEHIGGTLYGGNIVHLDPELYQPIKVTDFNGDREIEGREVEFTNNGDKLVEFVKTKIILKKVEQREDGVYVQLSVFRDFPSVQSSTGRDVVLVDIGGMHKINVQSNMAKANLVEGLYDSIVPVRMSLEGGQVKPETIGTISI